MYAVDRTNPSFLAFSGALPVEWRLEGCNFGSAFNIFRIAPVCLDVMTCFGFGVTSWDFLLPKRPFISPTTLLFRDSDPPPRELSRSCIAVSHDGVSEPLRREDVLPFRGALGVELGELDVLGWKLLCRLSPAASALDNEPLPMTVVVADIRLAIWCHKAEPPFSRELGKDRVSLSPSCQARFVL
jgi:hypothetical protein